MKKVSIIIPVYNVEKYLCQCLDSVLKQTYQRLEILLVDDGSTDQSGEICEKYAASDERIKLIHQKNAGAANAKNVGLDLASGEYITFIDSDDYVEYHWVERMVTKLEDAEADLVECNFDLLYQDRVLSGNGESFCTCEFTDESYMAQYLDNWTNSLFWNKLFKAEITEGIRFRKERRCIDDEFYTYKLIGATKKVVRIDDVLYHYRKRKSGAAVSKEQALQRTEDALEILIERYEWIGKRYPILKKYVLEHDICNLHFFAKSFPFSEKTVDQFQKIRAYYVRECRKNHVEIQIKKEVFMLRRYRRRDLLKEKSWKFAEDEIGLFD